MVAKVFLAHQINTLVEFYNVTIITNMDNQNPSLDNISNKVNVIHLPIRRNISLFYDLKALFLLILIFYKNKFTLAHSVSPKAGLLNSIAARITSVPNRLHTFTGQVWFTRKGPAKWILKKLDKIIVLLNTNILVDSHSQQKFLINQKVLSKNSSIVLGNGSISGVDINRFQPSKTSRDFIREKLKINENSLVFLFVGRLKRDKGICELIEAFKKISISYDNLILLVVGPDEENLKQELMSDFEDSNKFIKFVDFTNVPEQYMAASDIFILPSYREGFGNVIIEAASCELPSIGSNIYGLSDSIKEGETGLLIQAKSSKILEKAMIELISNNKMRCTMGINARRRVIQKFSQEMITSKLIELYKRLIK